MQYEIINSPFHVTLFGFRGTIDGETVPVVGKRLMDMLWGVVHAHKIKTKGINYWVYLPNSEMFAGVELAAEQSNPIGQLDPLEASLERYLRHVHKGPYAQLPQIWPQLMAALKQQGEAPAFPNLEIYGHWHSDETKCETTIIIGLKQ
ncbi:MAG: GyrI-like domain-containing protein [Caldilineaceae bacterium]